MKEKIKFAECNFCDKQIYKYDEYFAIIKSLEKLVDDKPKGDIIEPIETEEVLVFCKKCGGKITEVTAMIDGVERTMILTDDDTPYKLVSKNKKQ